MQPRRRLLLMRHGAVDYFDEQGRPFPPDDVPLTPQGEAQAKAAGQLLAGLPINRVITSGLLRTRSTAALALAAAGLERPVEHWDELREIRGGHIAALGSHQVAASFTAAFKGQVPLDTRFLGGESVGELLARTVPALERLIAAPDWDCALLVLHGGVNRGLLSWLLTGQPMFLGGLEQDPGCINVIDVGDGPSSSIVRALNLCPGNLLHAGSRLSTMERLLLQYQQS